MEASKKLITARSLLVLDHCFWGTLALRLKMRPEPEAPTAGTDGEHLVYNPEYIDTLTLAETIGVEAHEVGHCALGHIWRIGSRDLTIANIAADYVLNQILIDAGFTLPKGALLDRQFNGKSFEDVYDILYKKAMKQPGKDSKSKPGSGDGKGRPGQGQGQGQGKKGQGKKGQGQGQGQKQTKYPDPGKCGGVFKPKTPSKTKEGEMEWKAATAQAVQMSQGTIPGSLKKLIMDEFIDPKIPWFVKLRDFVERTARNDYNWARPNSRYLSRDIILPSLISEELQRVVFVIDSSGSTNEFQEQFAGEASGVLSAYKTDLTLIYCDAKVQEPVEHFTSDDLPLKLEPKGYGGTDFRPPFDYIEKEGINPSCLIYLTDTYGPFPNQEPNYPVLWVSVIKDKKAPWGETIEMI